MKHPSAGGTRPAQRKNEMTDEHAAMLTCSCSDADRLTVICLSCGRVHMFDPAYIVVVAGFALMAWNLWGWIAL